LIMSNADTHARRGCVVCGEEVPEYVLDGKGRCTGCHWDLYIPEGYEDAEHYALDKTWGHLNAERSPALGVAFLDAGGPRSAGLFNVPITWTFEQRMVWYLASGYTQEETAARLGMPGRTLRFRLARVRSEPIRLMGGAGRSDGWFFRLPAVRMYLRNYKEV